MMVMCHYLGTYRVRQKFLDTEEIKQFLHQGANFNQTYNIAILSYYLVKYVTSYSSDSLEQM